MANERYVDARKVLLMAHKMAPEAKRVIYNLVDLYLRMGYRDLAEFYYNLYMFDAEPNFPETTCLNYIYKKAQGCPYQDIETLLFPMYSDVMDYDWSFELYLLMKVQNKDEAKSIKDDYIATYKNEPNVILMDEIEQSQTKLEELFFVYPKENIMDDDPEQEDIRQEEKILMVFDDNRINPKEAQIQILFEDNEKASFGAKLKLKKHIKEQEKLAKKEDKSLDNESQYDNDDLSGEETYETDVKLESQPEDNERKQTIFKKLFSRKKNTENIDGEELEDTITEEETLADDNQQVEDSSLNVIKEQLVVEELKEEIEIVVDDEESKETVETNYDSTQLISEETEHKVQAYEMDEEIETQEDIGIDTATEFESEQESTSDMGDSVMQEIYGKKKISIVTELGEDTFVNTKELEETVSSNPFKDMLERNKDSVDEEIKTSFVFEEVQLQPEDDEYEVDDFSDSSSFFSFDEKGQVTDFIEDVNADETVENTEEFVDSEEEYAQEETAEEFVEPEMEYEREEFTDSGIEYTQEDVVEDYSDIKNDSEEKYDETHISKTASNYLKGESVYDSLKKKGSMDFPEFKTTLFPEYGVEVVEVDNNFDQIMTEAQDKINKNLLKEEQMQKEAEALLASLGIDLGNVKSTIKAGDTSFIHSAKAEGNKVSNEVKVDKQVETPIQVEEQTLVNNTEPVHNYSPSRDELKSSLKIDSVKKNILKQIKEYR